KVEVEVANVDQTLHIQEVLDRLPDEVEGKHPQAEVPQTRHVLGALGNKDLGKFLATAELAVVDALREKRQEKSHKNNIAAFVGLADGTLELHLGHHQGNHLHEMQGPVGQDAPHAIPEIVVVDVLDEDVEIRDVSPFPFGLLPGV